MNMIDTVKTSLMKYKEDHPNIFVMIPYEFKSLFIGSIKSFNQLDPDHHYNDSDFCSINYTICKFCDTKKICFINLEADITDEFLLSHVNSYYEFLESKKLIEYISNQIRDFKDENFIVYTKIFVAIPLRLKDQLFKEVNGLYNEPSNLYYVNPEERFVRLHGAICEFSEEFEEIKVFQEVTKNLEPKYKSIYEDFFEECRQNSKNYRDQLRKDFYERNKGKTIEIEVTKLFELAGFLIASSHYEDMGKMPYPHFQNISHKLGYDLAKLIGERKVVAQTSYDIFDSLKDE